MSKHDVIREVREIKTKVSYGKRIGFFFGAGTSCALGVPNIFQLTSDIATLLDDKEKSFFEKIQSDIRVQDEKEVTIEDVLNHIRLIRYITKESSEKAYLDINGEEAKELDNNICKAIYKKILDCEKSAELESLRKFFAWLYFNKHDYSNEIFTTNYDLLIEKALEEIRIPYFDGFVGSYEPFFLQESIEKFVGGNDLTKDWLRLWKLHGSLNWFWKEKEGCISSKIIRIGKIDGIESIDKELVIYPTRDKYDLSRKQPYIAYFDRLKRYLLDSELLFIFIGYSFSDQHINDIIFDALRENNRLHVIAFLYCDDELKRFYKISSSYLNLSAFSPKYAIINGSMDEWDSEFYTEESKDVHKLYWNHENKSFRLGDFKNLIDFLVLSSGKSESIEAFAYEK
jgi:hypothetical protein